MKPVTLKVGDLAKQTGVSTRTLHYYDEIGLLSPSQRTEAGYRLYDRDEIIRLQQIVSLRKLGFSLEQIQACLLEKSQFSPQRIVQMHLCQLKEQIALQQQLCAKLETIAARLQATETISTEEFIQVIEVTTMIDQYYTEQQLDDLKARREQMGKAAILQAQADWQTLIEEARTAQSKGIEPADLSVQALAKRWMDLVQSFTGGDAKIERSLNRMYQEEGPAAASQGAFAEADPLWDYMGNAIEIFNTDSSRIVKLVARSHLNNLPALSFLNAFSLVHERDEL